MPVKTPLDIRVAAATDVGAVRTHNEDAWLVQAPWFVVADGMGGHEAGEVASAATVAAFAAAAREQVTPALVAATLARAQDNVVQIGSHRPRSAGSTVTGLVLVDDEETPQWYVFNVGDSRVYRWLDGELIQLTIDHSLVQELVDQGRLTRDEARRSSHRNVITRALGSGDHQPDYFVVPVVNGERFVACSDGLSSEVDDSRIAAIVAEHADAQECADGLIREALASGGRDNVTVVVVDVVAGGAELDPDEDTLISRRTAEPVLVDAAGASELNEETTRGGQG